MAFAEPPGWYVISLRPQGGHASLRHAASAQGARLIALSPWRVVLRGDDQARQALARALPARRLLFTSPNAVRAAAALLPLVRRPGQTWIAVGSGTAAALRKAGVDGIDFPSRMDSEGLLALPALKDLQGIRIGLVTAPEGREVLSSALRERGAEVLRADVYAREPIALSTQALRKLRTLDAPAALALSSGGALKQLLDKAPADLLQQLRNQPVVAASARLQQLARDAGFAEVELAEGPLPRQLIAAMARRFR
ncbi:uroporphyrinogen-III synthase [Pseudoxanthomonas sacheonensis]|uniref:Uroporphyrinogen-III synthase n=1 Tax=Pseudoxanthomonas sacheonensis TaxID=443615 RepID=A0ABU1RSA9_9GAMM|nr:uroporphyrinogen-III synthase [Pseudoxanthomonas sacheonensis]MDR6841671.1 uroporphyrinogen-III synthase [Pseudoxanthomonas sacheonensis]